MKSSKTIGPLLLSCLISLAGLHAQGPTVFTGGAVDAASFRAIVSRGGIGSIFGSELSAGTGLAVDLPLPTTLEGVQVLVDGRAAPLFFVSASQINFQVPFETAVGEAVEIVVTRDGNASPAVTVRVADFAPAVFVNPNTGEPIVQRHPDGALITAQNPAQPGDVLVVFLTGLGSVTNAPASGEAAGVPLSAATVAPLVTVGGVPTDVLYAGLAPFFAGLGQVNIQLAQAAALGKSQSTGTAPLIIDFDGAASFPVDLPMTGVVPPSGLDLSVEMVEVLPAQAIVSDTFLVRYAIFNPGVSGSASRELYLSSDVMIDPAEDMLINTRPVTLRGEDQTIRSTGNDLPQGIAQGAYFAGVVLRFANDPNPSNNSTFGVPFEIVAERPPFDAAITLDAVSQQAVGPGDSFDLIYTATGLDRLTGRFRRIVYLSTDNVIDEQDRAINSRTFSLSEGETTITSRNIVLSQDTDLGDYFVGVILQAEGDTNLANNVSRAIPLRVVRDRRPYDFGIELREVSTTALRIGEPFDLTYAVANPGRVAGQYERRVVLSETEQITESALVVDRRRVTLSGSGGEVQSRGNEVPDTIPPGNYFLGMIIETSADTNPADNFSNSIAVTVAPARAGIEAEEPLMLFDEETGEPEQERQLAVDR